MTCKEDGNSRVRLHAGDEDGSGHGGCTGRLSVQLCVHLEENAASSHTHTDLIHLLFTQLFLYGFKVLKIADKCFCHRGRAQKQRSNIKKRGAKNI